PFLRPGPGSRDQGVHRPTRRLPGGVVTSILVAAAGIDEMREIEFREILALDEVEQRWQFGDIVLGHGEAHADLHAAIAQETQRSERRVIRALLAAEAVMRCADAVE